MDFLPSLKLLNALMALTHSCCFSCYVIYIQR